MAYRDDHTWYCDLQSVTKLLPATLIIAAAATMTPHARLLTALEIILQAMPTRTALAMVQAASAPAMVVQRTMRNMK